MDRDAVIQIEMRTLQTDARRDQRRQGVEKGVLCYFDEFCRLRVLPPFHFPS